MKYFIRNIDESKSLFGGILLFIILDISTLTLSYWTAHQSEKDAVMINLSGRQRMLTQRMIKSLLLQLNADSLNKEYYERELRDSALVFDKALSVFEFGGKVVGGDGLRVMVEPIATEQASSLIHQANEIWRKTHEIMQPYLETNTRIPDKKLAEIKEELLGNNTQLLDLMNSLTSHLEQESRDRLDTLRFLQTAVFVLALVNFFVIVRRFHLMAWRVRLENDQISELALRDHLTGLFNRRQYEKILERERHVADLRPSRKFVVLLLDLDGFKPINDTYGHEAGDTVLQIISSRLLEQARTTDTVARVGGDEFAMICPYLVNDGDAEKFCERLIISINQPIALDSGQVSVGASIGFVFYPAINNACQDITRLADTAMYAAKKAGRNRYVNYNQL